MTAETIAYLVAGAAMGGFVNGLAGTGTALFALGFFLNVLSPPQAVAVVAFLSVIAGIQGIFVVRAAIRANPRRLLRFLVPGVLGVPVGIAILSVIDADALKLFVGLFLILFGGYFSLRRALPKFERPTPRVDVAIGGLGGILGGAASLSGALPMMWCSMRPWPKAETRAVLQPFNVSILGLTILMLALRGTYTADVLWAMAVAVPVTLVSAQIGIAVFHRLSDTVFRWLLIGLSLLIGLGIVLGTLL